MAVAARPADQCPLRSRRAPIPAAPRPSSISAQWLSVGTGAITANMADTVAGPVTLVNWHALGLAVGVQLALKLASANPASGVAVQVLLLPWVTGSGVQLSVPLAGGVAVIG